MYYIYNRPVSPHLSIYSFQFSSMLSILHRFSGIFMIIYIIFFLIFNDLLSNLFYVNNLIIFNFIDFVFILKFVYLILNYSFFYHFLNGFRYLIFSFNLLSDLKKSYFFSIFFIIFFLFKSLNLLILLCYF